MPVYEIGRSFTPKMLHVDDITQNKKLRAIKRITVKC